MQLAEEKRGEEVEEVDNFLDSLKSTRTKEAYSIHRKRFLQFVGRDSINEDDAAEATSEIIRYLKRLKDEGLSYSHRNITLSAIKHDYVMRDALVLNWAKIAKFLGENERKYDIRGYTHDEIRKLLDVADIKYRAIILMLASTGMRRDALIKIESNKDLEYLEDYGLYKVKIYKKSKFEQICFTTPEAAEAIKLYMSKRPGAKYFHNVKNKAISKMLGELAIKAGLISKKGLDGSHRNEVPAVHGLRKFAATQMGRSDMKVEAREIVLGHSIGVRAAYQKYEDEDLLQEYLKAVDLLTINEANRLRKKVDALEEKGDEIRLLKEELQKLNKEVARLRMADLLNDRLMTDLKKAGFTQNDEKSKRFRDFLLRRED